MPEENKSYEETGRNYRYFATWRQLGLTAGIVVAWGVASLTHDALKDKQASLAIASLLGGALVQVALWVIDRRTREHTLASIAAGMKLEPEGGYFTELQGHSSWVSHSLAAHLVFFGFAVAFALYAVHLLGTRCGCT